MSLELTYLLWSTALALVYVNAQALLFRLQTRGTLIANATRDADPAPSLMTGRAQRALRNFLETYGIFIALVLVVELSDRSDWLTQWGAIAYVWGRVLYLPAYIFGFGITRSAIWTVSIIGLVAMFIGVLA